MLAQLQGSARTPLGPKFATSVFPCAHLRPVFMLFQPLYLFPHNAKTTNYTKLPKPVAGLATPDHFTGPLSHALRAKHGQRQ